MYIFQLSKSVDLGSACSGWYRSKYSDFFRPDWLEFNGELEKINPRIIWKLGIREKMENRLKPNLTAVCFFFSNT